MTLHRTPAGRLRPLAVALLALAAILIATTAAPDASAAGRTLNVNPFTGADTNPATTAAPLKTLTKALKLAQAGDTVKLAGGPYGPATSGDQYPAAGLPVRSGVTILGAVDSGFPVSTLAGPGSGAALNLTGNATVRNLVLGGQGFGVGVFAKQGTQTLSNVFIGTRAGATAVIDGLTWQSAAVVLRGTAQATLNASSIFLCNDDALGVMANEQARITMNGGTITGGDQANCRTNITGIQLNQAAQATINNANAPGLKNIAGVALSMRDTSTATVTDSLISRALPAGCTGPPSITVNNAAALTLRHSDISQTHATGALIGTGIAMASTAPLRSLPTTTGGYGLSLGGFARGIEAAATNAGSGDITLDRTFISRCHVCLDAGGVSGKVTITNSDFSSGGAAGDTGIIAPSLVKLRNTNVSGNRIGVLLTGRGADLGTASEPGNNDLRAIDTGVKLLDQVTTALVRAEGNTWHPNTQGADADGHYTQPLLLNGLSPLAQGENFDIAQFNPSPNVFIRLASVGAFKLSPRTLTARPGRVARWKLAWTHPVDWKRLDEVVLRLESRGKPVGRIVLDQQTRELRATGGPTVRLLAGGSAVSRGQAGGKRVTARIALRIAKRYAGRALVAKVAASDDNGARQGFRTAGRIRVLAR
jgi:hypothetical protein